MLEVKGVTKTFDDLVALDNVSFVVPKGQILGLIGQNGAGKSTTFRLILKFIEQDKGEILWNNHKITETDYNDIGYLPEERGLYPKETIEKQLIYFAKLRGRSKKETEPMIDYWMDKFQVKGKKTDKVKSLSKGNQQKVQLISTLIHKPKLVILDEPFSGLDPVNAALLKEGILELKSIGTCVIFSSHNMDNVEKMCDHLLMLKNGKIVLDGQISDIRNQFGRTELELETILSKEDLEKIEGVKYVEQKKEKRYKLYLMNESVGKTVFEQAVLQEDYLKVFNQHPPTLEDIFKMKVGEIDE